MTGDGHPESWRAATERFYRPLGTLPDVARRVGWNDDAGQRLRHRGLLASLGDLAAFGSVVDAGCGEATMLATLRAGGFAGAYRGEELLPEVAARGQATVGGDPQAAVVVGDLFADGPAADLVLCSGALNVAPRMAGPDAFDAWALAALDALWARTRVALAFDVAVRGRHHSDRDAEPGQTRDIATHDLRMLHEAARERTDAVVVREDVVPGEAVLVLWRRRGPLLNALIGGEEHAVARARILLREGDPDAALATLPAESERPDVVLWRAVVSLGRDAAGAERALRECASGAAGDVVADEARVHLAAWLCRSGRDREARRILRSMVEDPATEGRQADHARWLLLERFARDAAERAELVAGIQDAGIRRMFEPTER